MGFKVAVAGATGNVGREMLSVLDERGFPADQVVALARMVRAAGLQGVVASPLEVAAIRAACGPDFVIVTPGIRGASAGMAMNDQARTMGPAEAVRAGATFIVVGRPVIGAADPRQAAAAIVAELAATAG